VICGNGSQCSGGFHYGADIGTGCGSPIYAASSGTVVYAGRNGTYGNWVQIDHGNGVRTGYAHIRDGGTFVAYGQSVDAGQNIASSGMTGAADGCHLHYEVFINGGRINPFPFMADRGVPLG
jgi:murein DD-endopeptidase MepM/ murein hydrolase activator NlpD